MITDPERAYNFWVYFDYRAKEFYLAAGKEYVLSGSKEEKLKCLKYLAQSDFLTVKGFKIYSSMSLFKLIPITNSSEILEEVWADIFKKSAKLEKDDNRQVILFEKNKRFEDVTSVISILVKYEDGIRLHTGSYHELIDFENSW